MTSHQPASTDTYWGVRAADLQRHLADLRVNGYEGAQSRDERVAVFRRAFSLLTPTALDVLGDFNRHILDGTGVCAAVAVQEHESLGFVGRWTCSWPEQREATNRFTGGSIEPLTINAAFPADFTHGHLCVLRFESPDAQVTSWPLQVASELDAARQRPVLEVMCETELHQLIFLSNWRLLPVH
jgi:hypothetical protein